MYVVDSHDVEGAKFVCRRTAGGGEMESCYNVASKSTKHLDNIMQGDASSNTLQSEAVARWRDDGNQVSEATWEMTLTTDEFNAEADKMRAEGNHFLFTHLVGGNHRATWFVS